MTSSLDRDKQTDKQTQREWVS